MTSPSWPVSVRPSGPSETLASTKRTSPPAPVTARPVTTPGTLVRSAAPQKNGGRAPRPARGELRRHLAQQLADLALEVPPPRLTGVVRHDGPQCLVAHLHL